MKKKPATIILSLVILFSLFTVARSFYYSDISGGTDLRNRVVGARLMGKGYSPYFYKSHTTDDERLLDPNDIPSRLVNGNTVTPAVLYAIYPLTYLHYPRIRLIWTILQLLAAIAIVCMMLRRYKGSSPLTAAGIVVLGLFCSDYWFMHVERGQMTVFYIFLFALAYYTYTAKWKYAEFISGFIGGLFILFRPFAIFSVLGFLIHGKMKWIEGCITGMIAGMLIFVVPNPSYWKDYFKAMEEYGNECLGKGHIIKNATENIYPAVIEGARNLTEIQRFDISSMPSMYGYFVKLGINYTAFRSWLVCSLILLILCAVFFQLKKRSTPSQLFLFAFLAYITGELFLLNWRSPYNLIEWVFPLFLIVQYVEKRSAPMILIFTALLLLHKDPFYFHYQALLGEMILLFLTGYIFFTEKNIETAAAV
jgi:hypothetical protein